MEDEEMEYSGEEDEVEDGMEDDSSASNIVIKPSFPALTPQEMTHGR
jgi:hypothetical protein